MLAFNRGLLSKYGLARVDLKRTSFSAEVHTNWMPRVLGNMMLRPGLKYLLGTASNAKSKSIPFVFSNSDYAQLELTDSLLRPLVSDAVITRTAVSTAITNGTFTTNLTGWTSADETGAVSSYESGDYLGLLGTGFNAAIRKQSVTVAGGDLNVEHALRIIVVRGPVMLRVGSTDGGDELIRETALGTGTHSLAFTPTASPFYIRFFNSHSRKVLVDSVAIESAGTVTLPTPWTLALLPLIRWDQSADVVYVACDGVQQRKIERRNNARSWSIVLYEPDDGPFRVINLTRTTITPSAEKGEITLTASKPLFASTHVGGLFRLTSTGQNVSVTLSGANQFGDTIRVTGIGSGRNLTISISGTWVASITLQRSIDEIGWTDVYTWTSNPATGVYNDALDNQIVFYRAGIKPGNYTSGTALHTIDYAGGSRTGIVRVTARSSTTSASATVIANLGGITATENWSEGTWSDYRGFPTAVALDDGRLWWFGRSKIIGSVSDAYESFDDTIEGDSGPIQRSIGSGPVDSINWGLALDQLMMGTGGAEVGVRSSALGEVITPANFNLRDSSTQGSSAVAAVKADKHGFFVQKSQTALYQLSPGQGDYESSDASILVSDLLEPTIVSLAVQRKPDTRIHCVLNDGTVAVLIFDRLEDVSAWILVETDGDVEDVTVLPGTTEDKVVYTVKRTINASTVRYHEAWALESECRGGAQNKQADAFVAFTQASSTTITVGSHLEGAAVVLWANGIDRSPDVAGVQTTYTVSGGTITGPVAVTSGVVGLPYTADWKSSKLAYFADGGTALTQKKRIVDLALIMTDTHARGLKYGQDFDHLYGLPGIEAGKTVDPDSIWDQYDFKGIPANGRWDTDARLCLRAQAPRPVNISAAILMVDEHG